MRRSGWRARGGGRSHPLGGKVRLRTRLKCTRCAGESRRKRWRRGGAKRVGSEAAHLHRAFRRALHHARPRADARGACAPLARRDLGRRVGAERLQRCAWSEKARLSCWFDEARPRGARRTASSSRGGATTIWFAGSSSSEIATSAGSSFSSATGFGPICPSAFVSCTACAHAGRRRIRNGADDFELKARGAGSGADGR